jgi:hypothetical protein
VVAHGAGAADSNIAVPIMTQQRVRSSLQLKTIMETVVVMSLVLNRRTTVLVDIVDIVAKDGKF